MSCEEHSAITPETKVGRLLDERPELESALIELAPVFRKLRNPVLRKTVAKVTSLRHAAKVAGIPLGTMINTLRRAAGESEEFTGSDGDSSSTGAPDWFDESRVVATIDARPMLEAGDHPVGPVMARLGELADGEILELITPFVPAPLIDLARQKGGDAWSRAVGEEEVRTAFRRANSA